MIEGLLPLYASIGSRAVSDVFWDTFVYLAPAARLGACRRADDNLTKTGRGCES